MKNICIGSTKIAGAKIEQNKSLSVCIPTYNRESFLAESLELLISRIGYRGIPIYISDNCSTDNTEKVVKQFQKNYPYISYEKNYVNLGYEKNFEKVLKMSNTKYKWVMGDDDYFEGDIDVILEALEFDYSLVVLNRIIKNGKNFKSNEIITDPNYLLGRYGGHLTYICTLILSAEMVETFNFSKYYHSNFIQLGMIFEYFATHSCNVLCLYNNHVSGLPTRKNTYSDQYFEIFIINFVNSMQLLPDVYDIKTKKKCIRNNNTVHLYPGLRIFYTRINNMITLKKLIRFFSYVKYSFYPKQVVFLVLLCLVPKSILLTSVSMFKSSRVYFESRQRKLQ